MTGCTVVDAHAPSHSRNDRVALDVADPLATESTPILPAPSVADDVPPVFDPTRPWRAYMRLLEMYPLAIKMLTAAVIGALSDLIAQCVESSGSHWFSWLPMFVDWQRVSAFGIVAALLTAPMLHYLYEFMEQWIPVATHSFRNTMLQVVVDQLVACPIWLLFFFPLVSVFEGEFNFDNIVAQVRRDYYPSLKLCWIVFPVAQWCNFTLLPSNLRTFAVNVFELGYTAGLSYIKHVPQENMSP